MSRVATIAGGICMTKEELIERVQAEILAMRLEQGTPANQQPNGYLVMGRESVGLLFGTKFTERLPPLAAYAFRWKGTSIYIRTSMALGEVESRTNNYLTAEIMKSKLYSRITITDEDTNV